MIRSQSYSEGFSAVELLITLFIAAAFIATGYQLFSFAISSGGDTNAMARANSIGYERLRTYQADIAGSCVTRATETPASTGLTNPVISYTCTAPEWSPASSPVRRIEVTVAYGPSSNRQEVRHALYVN